MPRLPVTLLRTVSLSIRWKPGWSSPAVAREKIDFRYFVQDSETNLRSAIFSNVKLDPKPGAAPDNLVEIDPVPSSFAALPKLFRTRWIVGVPAQPVRLTRGSRIEVAIEQTQEIDSKPALIQRAAFGQRRPRLDRASPEPAARSRHRPAARPLQATRCDSQRSTAGDGGAATLRAPGNAGIRARQLSQQDRPGPGAGCAGDLPQTARRRTAQPPDTCEVVLPAGPAADCARCRESLLARAFWNRNRGDAGELWQRGRGARATPNCWTTSRCISRTTCIGT